MSDRLSHWVPGLRALREYRASWLRNDIVAGPGGRQILLEDPSGNLVELFEPAPGQ